MEETNSTNEELLDENGEKKEKSELMEWIKTFAFAIAIALLIRMFVFEMVSVHQSSMYPTLQDGQNIGIFKLAYAVSEPERGDIIVIKISEEKNYVKRVIATEGQKVEIIQNVLYIDGEETPEEYLPEGLVYNDYGPIVVPEGYIFVMGDNRPSSIDSRAIGCLPEKDIIGKAVIRFIPFTIFK